MQSEKRFQRCWRSSRLPHYKQKEPGRNYKDPREDRKARKIQAWSACRRLKLGAIVTRTELQQYKSRQRQFRRLQSLQQPGGHHFVGYCLKGRPVLFPGTWWRCRKMTMVQLRLIEYTGNKRVSLNLINITEIILY